MRQSVTDATFAAFLHCETKAFLLNEGTRTSTTPSAFPPTIHRIAGS